MTQHNMCQCVIASMLSTTATAWAQKPVDFPPLENTEHSVPARPHGAVKFSDSIFSIPFSHVEFGCHALLGPRCYPSVGKSPGE
jgi:hypothetical protein